MNKYEERLQAKRERLEARAARLRAIASSLHTRARSMAAAIPFGQPILIGHHSESRDRNFRGRITRTFRASFDALDRAEAAERRAGTIGTGGISSDDPEALRKLREKLEAAEKAHRMMKEANRIIRKAGSQEGKMTELVALGFTQEQSENVFKADCFGYVGFAPYSLTNSNGRMMQIKDRIAAMERKQARAAVMAAENPEGEAARVEEGQGFTFREDLEENRFMFIFPGKPDEQTRSTLKKNGFKWSPTRGAWVRQISPAGRWAVDAVKKALRA